MRINKRLKGFALGATFTLTATGSMANVSEDKDVQAGIALADAWLQTQLEYDGVPGASFAIVSDQEVIWSKGFGYANLADKVPATPETKYSICSVSKLFTSIGVMQLRDEGKLSIDEPLKEILPWFEIPDHSDSEEAVNLRNILSHVAGLPREAITPYWTEVNFPSRQTLQEGVANQEPLYRPYQHFQYSNLGMSLAGEAIEAASGEPYAAYIQSRILNPLGMRNTSTDLPVSEYGGNFSAGYMLRDSSGVRKAVGQYTTNGIAPAAGFASSVNDLAKFASWQFRLLEKGGTEILKSTTLREMQRIHWKDPDGKGATWGLGFAFSDIDGKSFIGHNGYCPGYRTVFLTRPKDKLAVIGMVNVNDVNPSTLAKGVISLVSPAISAAQKKQENDKDTSVIESPDAQLLTMYTGIYGLSDWPVRLAIAETSKGLKGISLFAENPNRRPLMLKHEEDNVFRVLSKEGDNLYTVHFDMDDNGRAVRFWQHGQYWDRTQ
ncbi:serine hydrolase domain-containing protein [Biformimicrobium ophioploci]|uniref:Beta-lactamase-related domain-containing protein n=1 Tax=Biformimicrobium ophioploci TaxID=3036711 RepID=A0ABQ6LYF1_9GAMM|nr:serine hydrolase domain-containing protein [Microbulbifer sp. NKW57]GMG87076.1 hypothetical protein MNKW57_13970 [Microbulbifer sp. NKW57]